MGANMHNWDGQQMVKTSRAATSTRHHIFADCGISLSSKWQPRLGDRLRSGICCGAALRVVPEASVGDLQPDLCSIGKLLNLFCDVTRCGNQFGSINGDDVVERICAPEYGGDFQTIAPSGGRGSDCCARLVDKRLHSPIYQEAIAIAQSCKFIAVDGNNVAGQVLGANAPISPFIVREDYA